MDFPGTAADRREPAIVWQGAGDSAPITAGALIPLQARAEPTQLFDGKTLDGWASTKGVIAVDLAPPLLNIAPWLMSSRFIDSENGVLKTQRRPVTSCELWAIDGHGANSDLVFEEAGGKQHDVTVGANHCDLFEGRRVLLTMIMDDNLEWISDWLQFHIARHGADAVIIYNNRSSRCFIDTIYTTSRSGEVPAQQSGLLRQRKLILIDSGPCTNSSSAKTSFHRSMD